MSAFAPSPAPRVGRPPVISRDAVLEAGRALAEREGVDALSIRKLAAALDVTPRALYRHVKDKHDILVGVIERVVRRARVTDHGVPRTQWKPWLRATLGAMYRTLLAQPGVIPLLRYSLRVGPAATEVVDDVMGVLRSTGLDDHAASQAWLALMSYTVGAAALRTTERAAAATPDPFDGGLDVVLAGVAATAGGQA